MRGVDFDYNYVMKKRINVFLMNRKLSSRCQTMCQSNLLQFISIAKVLSGNLLGDFTIVKILGTFYLTATNCTAHPFILTNSNQSSRHQEKIIFDKFGRLKR